MKGCALICFSRSSSQGSSFLALRIFRFASAKAEQLHCLDRNDLLVSLMALHEQGNQHSKVSCSCRTRMYLIRTPESSEANLCKPLQTALNVLHTRPKLERAKTIKNTDLIRIFIRFYTGHVRISTGHIRVRVLLVEPYVRNTYGIRILHVQNTYFL